MTAREKFCAALFNGPLLRADAIVVLTGDGDTRLPTAAELVHQQAAPVVLITGGLDNPPYSLPASVMKGKLMGLGVAPRVIEIDYEAMNTWEQAQNTVRTAVERGWGRILIVASPYHAPRAFLTFLKALKAVGKESEVHILTVPTADAPWFGVPDGTDAPRIDLLGDEFEKCNQYAEHVASWGEGLEYLEAWEGR
jgi:uncharacterized SAM-binding protein YcdF (DUF218 family)